MTLVLSIALSIIGALIVFSILIFIHEMGHFLAAKIFNIKVHEFAIGMGPAFFKKQRGETLYALRLIPIGGFVKLEGEDETSDHPRSFGNAKRWKRIIVLAAGAFMNMLAGLILCIIIAAQMPTLPAPIIAEVIPGSVAAEVGLQAGDKIVKIGNTRINLQSDVMYEMSKVKGNPISIAYKRNGEIKKVDLQARYDADSARYLIGYQSGFIPNSFLNTFKYGYLQTILDTKQILVSLGQLVTGNVSFKQVSGPVGIVSAIGGAVGDAVTNGSQGWMYLSGLFLLITINLGIFNLLPFPALDGGRILFVLVEMVRRKPIPADKEGIVHLIGFGILIILVIMATTNDISGMIWGR